jgi:hypothetical protein
MRLMIGAVTALLLSFAASAAALNMSSINVLTANANLYVDGLDGDDSNTGTDPAKPWKTFAPAIDFLCYENFGNGYAATIFVSNASSISGAGGAGGVGGVGGSFFLNCDPFGFDFVVLDLGGGTLTPAHGYDGVQINNNMIKNGYGGGAFLVTNGTITCSGGGSAIHVQSGNVVLYSGGGSLTLGSCPGGARIFADGTPSRIFLDGGYTISGDAAYEIVGIAGGGIDFRTSATITCSGGITYSGAFAASEMAGWVYVPTGKISFSGCGSVSGSRYATSTNGVVNTNGGGANFLPGNAAGTTSTGGQYN